MYTIHHGCQDQLLHTRSDVLREMLGTLRPDSTGMCAYKRQIEVDGKKFDTCLRKFVGISHHMVRAVQVNFVGRAVFLLNKANDQ